MDHDCAHLWELNLLGLWGLKLDGRPVDVGVRQQRVIAALAILGNRSRTSLAGLLWPESSEAQSAGNLRTSLFHLTHKLPGLVTVSHGALALEPRVAIDLHRIHTLIAEIRASAGTLSAGAAYALYHAELLPGWYEGWVLFEQERLQQLRLDGLESLSLHFLRLGDTGQALEAALAAASIEPLRESAQLIVLQCHVQAGNHAVAWQAFHKFQALLEQDLGVRPSACFRDLLNSLEPPQAVPAQPAHARPA